MQKSYCQSVEGGNWTKQAACQPDKEDVYPPDSTKVASLTEIKIKTEKTAKEAIASFQSILWMLMQWMQLWMWIIRRERA